MASESIEETINRLEKIALRAEKMAQTARDVQEIQNVMSRHCFLDAQGKNREQVMEIWSKAPDVCWIVHNTTVYKGLDSIIHHYCDNWEKVFRPRMLEQVTRMFPDIPKVEENALVGWMKMHTNCTPFIIVASDGKTAKGTWESPGFVTALENGEVKCLWMWERFAVDFIKEDGKWKIWHFNSMIQFATPYEKSWAQTAFESMVIKRRMDMGGEPEPPSPRIFNRTYNPKELCGPLTPDFPPQPVPYETFDETFSYGV